MKLQITIALLLTACGSQDDAKQKDNTPPPSSHIDYQPTATPAKQDVTVQYEKVGEQYAIALDDQSQLPICDKANDRQLAYARTDNKFFACTTGVWTELDVHGQAGVAGAAGAAGTAGTSGASGKDGAKGDKGDKGDDGKPVDTNQWFDPVAQNSWLTGVIMTSAQMDSTPDICSSGWRLPTQTELTTAVQHGYGLAVHTQSEAVGIWTSSNIVSGGVSVRAWLSLTGALAAACTPTEAATPGIHCPMAAVTCLKAGGP